MSKSEKILWPISMGFIGALLLMGNYFGIVSYAESFEHAIQTFWEEK